MYGKEAFHNPVHNPKGYIANQGGRGLEGEVTLPGWGRGPSEMVCDVTFGVVKRLLSENMHNY